jgi:chromosome segregation ATPase
MHLTKIEIQGFKTFAKKTSLSFLPPKKGAYPITSVVGPNGSGKSNLADAIRWVLGEQSLRLLRGKKSEDVIFSGSVGKKRSGFAEVSITLDNTDSSMPIDFKEVVITRRLYRDGGSEYLLNNSTARLSDIQLLLAQANVGQRSYSVVGQGMIDHILVSTPEERKAFFDDATGVRPFQIKRHDAILKLKRTYENLSDVEMLLAEIEPRLRSLKRQASKLEKREGFENELKGLEHTYYGTLWWELSAQIDDVKTVYEKISKEVIHETNELKKIDEKTTKVETSETGEDAGLQALQKVYRSIQKEKSENRTHLFQTEKEIELSKVRAQSNWSPLPLHKIVEEVDQLHKELDKLKEVKDAGIFSRVVDTLFKKSGELIKRLRKPNPDDIKSDPKLVLKLKHSKEAGEKINKRLKDAEHDIDTYAAKEKKVRTELIDMQRDLRAKQSQIHTLENKRNAQQIELARFEERQNNLHREMDEAMKELAQGVRAKKVTPHKNPDSLYPDIQRLRYKLELIGGIDPEIVTEFEETKVRFEFLDTQTKDLQKAIESTEKIVKELDKQIESQSKKVFDKINKEFQRYFKILFEGGTCSLVKISKDPNEPENEVTPERAFEDTGEAEREKSEVIKQKVKKYDDGVTGIEIEATPPGKKLKSLNLLSGGERALTSIALISAIMAVNPSPFVVLDEVDAALDESNTIRFATILEDLSKNSQFIIITHNRATMEKADMLYGVTMGDEGISNLLSVHLEDVTENGTARR